ncbi:hypothetical protein COU23_01540 [Candidatus Kuenenbacteria bacterium CG10_big_fil_rev_8_21_14_0_10_36_11]|uniref:Uncharacterized protein n=1 Tax=Candidatus Kuenenbacteria bacterium CG10_big_fil_rev_8_21_14_0_10_36_11 TaxID=1974618 RepID=A0A2M6WAP0_9BACT|nr:MAG: hypothetical protein COU23_01540 [Candidatus Kuenenbacteria bacterium CG10_big_fil_rev_8_21_14_0_10_36_11]
MLPHFAVMRKMVLKYLAICWKVPPWRDNQQERARFNIGQSSETTRQTSYKFVRIRYGPLRKGSKKRNSLRGKFPPARMA